MEINNSFLSELENTAVSAAMVAGDILTDGFYAGSEAVMKSGPFDLVTPYDRKAENKIIERIRQDFPSHAFCGEEQGVTGDTKESITWVIDPIDGTLNFARQIPSFATSIAATYKGKTIAAVCFDPLARELFVAKRGGGAYMNGKRLHVSQAATLDASGISLGITVGLQKIHEIGFIRRSGSSVLDLCYVGKGALEGFIDFGLRIWDFAAASLIVEEAGGIVTTMEGTPLPFHLHQKIPLVASNGNIHGKLLEWISQAKK